MRLELTTPSLPRKCSTTELQRHKLFPTTIRTNQKSMTRSYIFTWSGRRGSNPPPIAWKAIALPNELLPHCFNKSKRTNFYFFVGEGGLEPPNSEEDRFTVCCNCHYATLPHLESEPMEGFEPPTR